MILAALTLIAIGAGDLLRRFVVNRTVRYIAMLAVAVLVLAVGVAADAVALAVVAVLLAALWQWSMPLDATGKASFWPAVALGVLVAATTALMPARAEPGWLGALWQMPSPAGEVGLEVALLGLGAVLFVTESANLVVRGALDREGTWRPVELGGAFRGSRLRQPQQSSTGFQGGRLIGPLERILVIVLTLAGAYSLLAAMLAAKGIVRFPEISKDGETGARAEYFLVGSLVSWVMALGAAFAIWWGVHV